MRDELGVGEGDELIVMKEDNCIVLTTPARYARSTKGMMRGTWGRSKEEVESYLHGERDSWR